MLEFFHKKQLAIRNLYEPVSIIWAILTFNELIQKQLAFVIY